MTSTRVPESAQDIAGSRVIAVIGVALTAVLAYAWATGLAFQIDDYWIIPNSGAQLRELAGLMADPAALFSGDGVRLPQPEVPLFQPVLWAQHVVERRCAGDPADAFVFHAVSVLLHASTAAALLVWLGRRFGPMAALPGALMFAIHPGAAQAVTWVAARGLVLILLLGLLASLAEQHGHATRRRRWEWLAGVLLGLAVGSQAAAATIVVAVMVPAVLRRRGAGLPAFLLSMTALLVLVVIATIVRHGYLGAAAFTYLGGTSAGIGVVPRMLQAVPDFALHVLGPWNQDPAVEDLAPLLGAAGGPAIWAAAGWVLVLVPALIRDSGSRRNLLVAGAAFAVLGAPALFLWSIFLGTGDARSARALYPALAAVAAALAAACTGIPGGTPTPWRRLRYAGLAILAFVAVDGLAHTARIEHRAAELIRARAAGIVAASAEVGPGGLVQVLDPHVTFAGVPLVSPKHVLRSVRPPFRRPALAVRASDDLGALLFEGTLTAFPDRIRILEWTGARYEPLGGILPAIPESLPPLAPADSDLPDTVCYRPAGIVPPRAAAAIRVPITPGAARLVHVLVRNDRTQILHELSAAEGADQILAALDEQQDWLLAERIEAVYVRGAGEGAPPPGLLRDVPGTEARQEPEGDEPLPVGVVPEFIAPGAGPREWVRIIVRARVGDAVFRTVYLAPPEAIDRSGPDPRYRPRPEDIVYATHESLRFDRIAECFERILGPYGLRRLTLEWRLSLFHTGRKSERARAPWVPLVFESR